MWQPATKYKKEKVVAHITNYNDLQVVVGVDELDISKVAVGQTATVAVSAFEDTDYTGTVTAVANEGTASNGVSTFDVTVHLDKSDNLKNRYDSRSEHFNTKQRRRIIRTN
ncbi:hypothetical protein GCM10020331_083060 [Ectobacillus funiculus]